MCTLHVYQLVRRVGKRLAMSIICTVTPLYQYKLHCTAPSSVVYRLMGPTRLHSCRAVCTEVLLDSLAFGRPEKGRGWMSLMLPGLLVSCDVYFTTSLPSSFNCTAIIGILWEQVKVHGYCCTLVAWPPTARFLACKL